MEYPKSKSGRLLNASVYEGHPHTSSTYTNNLMIADSKDRLRKMVRAKIQSILAKGHRVSWNVNTPYEVVMFKSSILSGYDNSDSEFIKTSIDTIVGMGESRTIIEHHTKTIRNPKYEGDLQCEFCYGKAAKLYPDQTIGPIKAKKNVCAKCKKHLSKMRKIWLQVQNDEKSNKASSCKNHIRCS